MPIKKSKPPKILNAREAKRIARERWLKARKAEVAYQRQLVAVAKQIGTLVRGFAPDGTVADPSALRSALTRYAEVLRPWARAVTTQMHVSVSRRDLATWTQLSEEMGRALRKEVFHAPTGEAMRTAMAEQIHLITSLPLEAAERVHKLTQEGLMNSERFPVVQREIMRTGLVTESRARLIARTETARTASLLLESRAKYIGGESYIWHTVHDSDVRREHRLLDGKVFKWNDPPIAGPGMRYNPGQGPNCRCFAEPIIPDVLR